MYFVYFLVSLTNSKAYVGYTSKDPDIRLAEHNSGTSAWTKANGPFKLIYFESYIHEEDARTRELFYKTGIGKRIKKAIIAEMNQ